MTHLKDLLSPEAAPWHLRLRPGAFDKNCDVILDYVLTAPRDASGTVRVPADAMQGGCCGSFEEHPAFEQALEAAFYRFTSALETGANAPRVAFCEKKSIDDVAFPRIAAEGPDPARPFCRDFAEIYPLQVAGLVKRLNATGCRDAVIGLSGGLDSALALLVTFAAFKWLGLPEEGIHLYTMPGFGTTTRTRGNAHRLAEGLGLALETVDITPACRQHFADIGQDETRADVTFENAQARERTQILMDKANQFNGLVIGTGDMSEIALGWCTYNGDHMSMFGVNAGVPKTAVRCVCRGWADAADADGLYPEAAAALRDILDTPVSPELLPSADDTIVQKTEDRVGPYELHDYFLWHFVANRRGRAEILAAAVKAFPAYAPATVEKWLDVFFKRLFAQAFKRNCAPDGTPVYSVYLSPHDWWIPSDMAWEG